MLWDYRSRLPRGLSAPRAPLFAPHGRAMSLLVSEMATETPYMGGGGADAIPTKSFASRSSREIDALESAGIKRRAFVGRVRNRGIETNCDTVVLCLYSSQSVSGRAPHQPNFLGLSPASHAGPSRLQPCHSTDDRSIPSCQLPREEDCCPYVPPRTH